MRARRGGAAGVPDSHKLCAARPLRHAPGGLVVYLDLFTPYVLRHDHGVLDDVLVDPYLFLGHRALLHRRLVARASEGDVEAFAKLVRAHSSLVYRVSLRILGNEYAQDASQEVWVRVWRNLKGFRSESAFSTWLYRITLNTCLSTRRREARRQKREYSGEEISFLPEASGGDSDPEAAVLSTERRNEIFAALRHVRAEHRAALVLRHMEGLSYAEVAEILQVPDGTAKGWASRGRATMLLALVKKTTAATERGGGRRQTLANQEEHREALQKTGACPEGKRAYLASTGVPIATCSDIDPPVS